MSDRVIRLNGIHAGDTRSINNLITFLNKQEGRTFIICSAYPEFQDIIDASLGDIFSINPKEIDEQLGFHFFKITGSRVTADYVELSRQAADILRGIRLTGDYSRALKDQVECFSEKLTAVVFSEQFRLLGRDAEIIYPEAISMAVTPEYGSATYLSLDKEVLSSLKNGVYLLPGSYGITENGKIARAGENAADYTAAFFTRETGVHKLELWGLTGSFYRADPEIVSQVQMLSRLTYSEASELAYFDHVSFHPRTVEPLEAEHIPVQVIYTGSGDGCVETIINAETYIEPQIVKGVACTDDISLLRLSGPGVGLKPGILARVASRLNSSGINIKSVITSQISIHLLLDKLSGSKALQLMHQLDFEAVQEIVLIDDVSLIGVIGHGMQQSYGVSAKIFSAIAAQKINVVLSGSGASDLASYLVVRSSDKEKSVREIYKTFFTPEC